MLVIISAAICPHPPLLVPTVAGGAAFETDDLRAACDLALRRMLAASPRQVVIIGSDGAAVRLRDFAPGAPGLPDGSQPLPLLIGDWLLDRVVVGAERRCAVAVRPDGSPVGRWPDLADPTGLLVMADGSARRSVKGPGYLDERAGPFDAAVTAALASADLDALLGLDEALAADLLVGGVGPLKALATLTAPASGAAWQAEILYDGAPYGVQYTVASWSRV
ncbi:MAG TPA: hypothetical protein VF218_07135 [Acidothermaceae bacterium]